MSTRLHIRSPAKWIEIINELEITSKRGKNGGILAHPLIACDFEMCNDMSFRYEVLDFLKIQKSYNNLQIKSFWRNIE